MYSNRIADGVQVFIGEGGERHAFQNAAFKVHHAHIDQVAFLCLGFQFVQHIHGFLTDVQAGGFVQNKDYVGNGVFLLAAHGEGDVGFID